MDSGKRQYLQDIYSTDRSTKDDFTPQVSKEVLEERKRQIRRHQFTNFILGMLVLILSVSLVFVVVRKYIEIQTAEPTSETIAQGFIPRYSLPSESQWVLDFSSTYGNPEFYGDGDRPFNAEWVRKAAFNLILGEQAARIGENDVAMEHYENVLEILPDIEGVKVPLGILYFKSDQFDKAVELLGEVPATDLTPDMLNNLGAAFIKGEAYDKAEMYLKLAIEKRVSYAEPHKNLAHLYSEQERTEEAIAAYQTYIDLRPTDVDTQHDFALYLTKLGRWNEAAMLLEGLVQQITDVPTLYLLLAQVQLNNNQPEKAILALQRGVQLTDPDSALAYMDRKEFEKLRASKEFQQIISSLSQPRKSFKPAEPKDTANP